MAHLTLCLLAVLAAGACADSTPPTFLSSAAVVEATDQNIDDLISDSPSLLVAFVAPWCQHCKKLAPDFEAAAAELKAAGVDTVLASCDATKYGDMAKRFAMKGFPAMKWFVSSVSVHPVEYSGGRSTDAIVAWVQKRLQPPFATLASLGDVDAFESSAGPVVVLGLGAAGGGDSLASLRSELTALSKAFMDTNTPSGKPLAFAFSSAESVAVHYGITQLPALLVLKRDDDDEEERQAVFTEGVPSSSSSTTAGGNAASPDSFGPSDDLSTFVKGHMLPLTITYTDATAKDIFSGTMDRHALLIATPDVNNESQEGSNAAAVHLAAFRSAARKRRGKVLFVTIPAVDDNVGIMQYFQVPKTALPALRFVALTDGMAPKQFLPEGGGGGGGDGTDSGEGSELSVLQDGDRIDAFIAGCESGAIKPQPMSAALAPDWNSAPVKVLVGTNHDSIAHKPSRNVLVMYYAPWCKHCKKMEPEFEAAAATLLEQRDDVILAKMDGTTNEARDTEVKTFPTVIFYPALTGSTVMPSENFRKTNKVAMGADVERTAQGIVDFVYENAVGGTDAGVKKKKADLIKVVKEFASDPSEMLFAQANELMEAILLDKLAAPANDEL